MFLFQHLDHQNQLKTPVLKMLAPSQVVIRMETKLLPKNKQVLSSPKISLDSVYKL